MKILGIETSCDDTSVAIYDDERGVLESLVSSQVDLHGHFQGVVPELASRAHLVNLLPLVDFGLTRQRLRLADLDGVAVTAGPGLIGALLVGLSTAKALAYTARIPLAGVHHLEGHILANALTAPLELPAVVLVVSGGHTDLYRVAEIGRYKRLGGTLDDAAGEAFDKSAVLLGLPYPGGPAIDALAPRGRPGYFRFPRPLLTDPRLVFSFSGLKTAVRLAVERLPRPFDPQTLADVARELQEAVVEILVTRLLQAARQESVASVYLAGGVAANRRLRAAVAEAAESAGLHFLPPATAHCTDNAAMIAYAGWCHLRSGYKDGWDLDSFAKSPLESWR